MAGWFRNEDGTSSSGGGRGGAATIAASAVSGSSRRTRGKALLRPVFALSALALVVFLALDDDQAGFGGPKPAASRRGLKLEGNGEEERVYPDGTVVRIVVDEHGERFAGVRYADDDRDLGGDGDLRGDASSSGRKLNHVEGHVLVQLSYGKDPDVECALLAELVGGTVEYVLKGGAFNGCSIIPSEFAMQSADGTLPLTGESGVDAVEEDGIVEAYQTQNWEIWNLNRIDQCTLPLEEGSYAKEDASGVKLFIMDTGVFAGHDEFAARPGEGRASSIDPNDACHFSLVESPMMPLFDGNGHGTHVAGTACGYLYGIATNCQICSVKVLTAAGYGSWSGMIAAINHIISYCDANPTEPCVVNMSLGGSKSEMFNSAVSALVESGVVVVVAAGNSNKDACLTSPASESSALTVGSTTLEDVKSSFSNFGACVDVYAPGSSILSASNTNPNMYSTKQGTSMAAPHVAGIAAAYLSANPGLTPPQVASAILGSASPIGSGMNLATKMGLNCGPDTSKPTRKPTKSPTMTPTLPPTPKPTSRPTPTCIQKNRLLGKTSEVCLGGRRLTTACCSGRCFDPNHRGRAYCR